MLKNYMLQKNAKRLSWCATVAILFASSSTAQDYLKDANSPSNSKLANAVLRTSAATLFCDDIKPKYNLLEYSAHIGEYQALKPVIFPLEADSSQESLKLLLLQMQFADRYLTDSPQPFNLLTCLAFSYSFLHAGYWSSETKEGAWEKLVQPLLETKELKQVLETDNKICDYARLEWDFECPKD